MDGFTEFYVSCNPPLLPIGVSSVIADVVNDLGQIVIEVLYEPEVPWFKFISAAQHQNTITRWMHDRLELVVETEVGLITEYQDEDDAPCSDPKAWPDVRVLAKTPHVVPYPSLLQISADIMEQYDPFRYPDHIKGLSYKRVWQSPEGLEGVTVPRLLSKYEPLLPASLTHSGIEKLGELTKCELSYNLRGSLVYIGSDHSEGALDDATRKLDTLASLMDASLATTSHLVFTEKIGQAKICYVWTAQIGLSRLTYVDPECSDLEEEYKRIAGAVTLRIGVANNKGLLAPESTTYPTESKASKHIQAGFRPFEGYVYGNKRSGTTAVKDQKRPLQCFQTQQPEKSRKAITPKGKQPSVVAKTVQSSPSECDSVTIWLGDVKEGEPPEPPNEIDEYEDAAPSLILSQMAGGLREPQQSQLAEIQDPYQLGEKLEQRLSVSSDRTCPSQPELGSTSSQKPTALHGAPELETPGVEKVHKQQEDPPNQQTARLNEQSLMDMFDGPISIPALMNQSGEPSHITETAQSFQAFNSEVIFGKRNDEPKSLIKTMNQKASAPGNSWANIASSKTPSARKQDDVNFGQNVRVTDSRPLTREKQQETYSKEAAQESQQRVPVSTTRVVPVMDTPTTTLGKEECVKVIVEAETKFGDMLRLFQAVPGRVRAQAKFGRLCIKGIPPAEVYMSPSHHGPFEFTGAKTKYLNANNPHVEFSPILTTSAAEANLIPQMIGGKNSWVLTGKRVYYEFLCIEESETYQSNRLVVNVDAETFNHECLPLQQEVSQAFVHCTRRAWDIKLGVLHGDMGQITEDFEKFAASLVRSLDIKTNEIGEIVIQVEPDNDTKWCVDRVRIHHEAKYRNGAKGPSCLTTTMVRVVEKFPNTPKKLYKGQSVPIASPGNGRVGQWFEATISSIRADVALQENAGLELGDKTVWSPDDLERHGALRAICEPAIRMVRQMDPVGNSNENGHGTQTDQPPFDAVEDLRNRNKDYSFW